MEPFKNKINTKVIKNIAYNFSKHYPEFDEKGFISAAQKGLTTLELKARTTHISHTMVRFLPNQFEESARILLKSLGPELSDELFVEIIDAEGIGGWAIPSLTYYVALQGQNHFELSMHLLKEMTKRFTAEFDIRHFIVAAPEQTINVLKTWAQDENHHVRRLASEGCRPKLPWGMSLPVFIKDPTPLIALLDQLKDDSTEYVRRSVANNLNDIAKDHPDLVAKIAQAWMKGASKERQKLIRHACRTLLKGGHKKTLAIFGYKPPKLKQTRLQLINAIVILGESMEFSLSISSDTNKIQSLMIDYVIHHQKANGKTSPKVFKWRTTSLKPYETQFTTKKHPMKEITTRVYHPGKHRLEIIINGTPVAQVDFQLKMTATI